MKAVLRIAQVLVSADRKAMWRGALLSVTVLVMGAALLGLSGWFITATGLAGLAGIGIAFDVFRPSAGVRFLALGRAAARYGERVLTHEATLRALAALRVVLLRGYARGGARALARLRGQEALTRIVSDVDALDGVILRLILPAFAALVTHILVFLCLIWLVGPSVALIITVIYLVGAATLAWRFAWRSIAPSRKAEDTGQALRRGVIDMVRDREALIMSSTLPQAEDKLLRIDLETRQAGRLLDQADRALGVWMSILIAAAAMAAFLAGAALLDAGRIGAAQAVIGLFVALALAEALFPLRRAIAELGRIVTAVRRVGPLIDPVRAPTRLASNKSDTLLTIKRPALELDLGPGEAVAITGPSGVGKTTLLVEVAGLEAANGIHIKGTAPPNWPEAALRDTLCMLPQRSTLIAGTIRENLALTGDHDDSALWSALEVLDMAAPLRARDGLDTQLGEGGSGFSGGQTRRLALARCLLRQPEILLLDEPTEGLDPNQSDSILSAIRAFLPNTLIVAAMHRGADHDIFSQKIRLHP